MAMAKEHHCPVCGPFTCSAATSKIHVCPKCNTRWEEDLSAASEANPAVGASG